MSRKGEPDLTKAELEQLVQHLDAVAARRALYLEAAGSRQVELDCETAGAKVICWGCVHSELGEGCYERHLPASVHAACVEDAKRLAVLRAGEPCHDCAFRRGSPESREEGFLARLIQQSKPFRCHQGMPLDGRGKVPSLGDYAPLDPDAYPVCAGWARARASWLARRRARDALRGSLQRLTRGQAPTARRRWYTGLGLQSWRWSPPHPRRVPTARIIDPSCGPWSCNTRRRRHLRATLRIERQREVWLGGERVGRIQCSGGSYRIEATAGGGPGWIFGEPGKAIDAFAVWLARAGRSAAPTPPRPQPPDPREPLPPGPRRPPAKRRRGPKPRPAPLILRAA